MRMPITLFIVLFPVVAFANDGEKVAEECSQRADIVSFIISGANIGAGRMDMSNRIMPTITAEYYQVDKAKQWVTKTIEKMFSDPDMPLKTACCFIIHMDNLASECLTVVIGKKGR